MSKSNAHTSPQHGGPRRWESGEEFEREAQSFLDAAHRFIGRGVATDGWCESQQLRLKLAHIIEHADYTASWQKTLQHMLRLAEGTTGQEHRRLAVHAIQAWAETWKLPQWQVSSETRRACLGHLVSALEAFDGVFAQLRHNLDSLAEKLDTYGNCPPDAGQKSSERILAELIVEGADALGFTVEPREPMYAEVLRIERQLERVDAPVPALPSAARTSKVMRKAQSLKTKKTTDG